MAACALSHGLILMCAVPRSFILKQTVAATAAAAVTRLPLPLLFVRPPLLLVRPGHHCHPDA
jgi:hypothetical protein